MGRASELVMADRHAERERISKKRVTGQLVQWKGKYGWIRPSQPIDHPDAGGHGGKVYLGIEDVEGQELTVKDMVSFFVYADETGLGAMHCRIAPGVPKPAREENGRGGTRRPIRKTGPPVGSRAAAVAQPKVSKGKGPGKGKARNVKAEPKGEEGEEGAEERERLPPPPPDKTARERVLTNRITGKLIRWRGEIGWIKPAEKIDHPEAPKHRKGIYVHKVDVQPGHELFQGAQVSFFAYSDQDGLGAEHVMVCTEQIIEEDEPPPKATGNRKKGKGTETKRTTMVEKMQEKRRRKRGGKKHPLRGEKTKGGPDLPRERVTTVPVSGEVLEWKGKFGWVSCQEEIEHELVAKHEGKIYLHEKDILDGAPLSVGQPVEFHVYADASGLGAEEAIATAS